MKKEILEKACDLVEIIEDWETLLFCLKDKNSYINFYEDDSKCTTIDDSKLVFYLYDIAMAHVENKIVTLKEQFEEL